MLKYPHDRHLGYVQLLDGKGNMYVPEFTGCGERENALAYCQAFMELARRNEKSTSDLIPPGGMEFSFKADTVNTGTKEWDVEGKQSYPVVTIQGRDGGKSTVRLTQQPKPGEYYIINNGTHKRTLQFEGKHFVDVTPPGRNRKERRTNKKHDRIKARDK